MTDRVNTVRLSDVALVIPGTSPSGRDINDRGEGLPFYQGAKEFGTRHPRPERFTTAPVKTAAVGDILLSVRAPVGRVNIADTECAIGRGVMAVRAKEPGDTPYVAAVLQLMGDSWDAHATDGTMFANLSKAGLEQLSIRWPHDRRRIAEVVLAVDERLEALRRLQVLLEDQGQTLLEEALLVDAGEVAIQDVAEVVMGNSPPGSSYNEGGDGVPLFQGCAEFGFRFPTRRLYTTAPSRMADPGDTLVSVRAPVGRLNLALDRCCIGRGLAAVRSADYPSLIYYALRSAEDAWSPYNSEGTVFGSINGGSLRSLRVDWPANAGFLEQRLRQSDAAIHQFAAEQRELSEARLTLLSGLMSGELRVAAAEELVEAAT